jgi:hypothetical protein
MKNQSGHWNAASVPPEGEAHTWTRDVIVVTDLGNVYVLAFMHGGNGEEGCWQRKRDMIEAEVAQFWCELPLGLANGT